MKTAYAIIFIVLVCLFPGTCILAEDEGFVLVEGGTFFMGIKNESLWQKPVHKVTVDSFYIGKYEVTLGQFKEFIKETGYVTTVEKIKEEEHWRNPAFQQEDDHPVVNISWYDSIEFCNWLSIKHNLKPSYTINKTNQDPNNTNDIDTHKWIVICDFSANGYRLPTEAEWEYAARGGNISKGYKYAGSNNIEEVAWYKKNSGDRTHAVGMKKPNELGLYDMSGNVFESCWDWIGQYPATRVKNPKGPKSQGSRVIRGGGWKTVLQMMTSTYRANSKNPDSGGCCGFFGFRLVRSGNILP